MEAESEARIDTLSLLLGPWFDSRRQRVKVYALASAIAQISEQTDPYEPDSTRWRIGCGVGDRLTRIKWNGNYWWVDKMILLLLAAEKTEEMLRQYTAELADPDHFASRQLADTVEAIQANMDPYMRTMLRHDRQWRDELLFFLIFLALSTDTRAERVCYKYSNILINHKLNPPHPKDAHAPVDHKLDPPKPAAIRSLRLGCADLLDAYVQEQIDFHTLRNHLNVLCMMGVRPQKMAEPGAIPGRLFQTDQHELLSDNQRTFALRDPPSD